MVAPPITTPTQYGDHTCIVAHTQLWVATALCVDMVTPADKDISSTGKSNVAGKVEGCVAVAITDQRVGVGLQQVLDHLVLPGEHS